MPATRPLVSRKIRWWILFAALLAIIPVLSSVRVRRTAACSAPPPVPLRELYMTSKRVVIARAGQSALLPTINEHGYDNTPLRTSFYVSRTLKGEKEEEVVHVYQWLYGEDRAVPEDFAEGKTLLLFLADREEGEGYRVTDYRYGAKQLSDDDLKVYVKRIEELEVILRDKEPDKKKIVEWLVRCAEEPATRWEGAYELNTSQTSLSYEEEKSKETKTEDAEEADVSAESATESTTEEAQEVTETETEQEGDVTVDSQFSSYTSEFARLLSEDHKSRLTNALFRIQEIADDDLQLLQLVISWDKHDDRLIPFVIAQLNKVKQDPPYYAERLVTALAEKLGDEKLIERAEAYCENAMYYDPDQSEAAESSDDDEEEVVEETALDREEASLTGNSAQKRSTRLQKFLAEVEVAMNTRIAMAQ